MSDVKSFFDEQGYYVAKGLFHGDHLSKLQRDFDRIVNQLKSSKEEINARWDGDAMKELDPKQSIIYHTHNVQSYSENWMRLSRSSIPRCHRKNLRT